MKKTIGTLVDELCVTNLKIYHLKERIKKKENVDKNTKKLADLDRHRIRLLNNTSVDKSIAILLDELCVTNLKIFMLIDLVQKNEHTKKSAKKLQDLNLYRSKVMNAINEYFDEEQNIKV